MNDLSETLQSICDVQREKLVVANRESITRLLLQPSTTSTYLRLWCLLLYIETKGESYRVSVLTGSEKVTPLDNLGA